MTVEAGAGSAMPYDRRTVARSSPQSDADRPLRAAAIGECLIELLRTEPGHLTMRPAGDTFNTAVMLARASRALGTEMDVAYVTGLGDDPLSDEIASAVSGHGLVDASTRIPGRACGLYLLDGDSGAMWYWRRDSAARALFQGDDWIPAERPDLVFLSLITLQQMSDDARERAADWLATIRSQGATVAFSANHRAAGWPSPERASAAAGRFVAASDIVFASVADCTALFAWTDPRDAADRLTGLGAGEVLVTAGHDGAFLAADGSEIRLAAYATETVDATGAGDAAAGTYLAWRSAGLPAEAAGRAAMRVASVAVAAVGALPTSGSPEEAAIDLALAELLPPAG